MHIIFRVKVRISQPFTAYSMRKETPLGSSNDSLFEVFGETNEECTVCCRRETPIEALDTATTGNEELQRISESISQNVTNVS